MRATAILSIRPSPWRGCFDLRVYKGQPYWFLQVYSKNLVDQPKNCPIGFRISWAYLDLLPTSLYPSAINWVFYWKSTWRLVLTHELYSIRSLTHWILGGKQYLLTAELIRGYLQKQMSSMIEFMVEERNGICFSSAWYNFGLLLGKFTEQS